jgi:CHAT domain-containing protein/TolA-binding protein
LNGETRTHCPSDDTLAAFVDGRVDAETRAIVLEHIETCADCMAAVLSANAQRNEESEIGRTRRPLPAWLAVAAAALIAVIAAPFLLRRHDPVARLVALAPHSARVVEPRLTGGFAWAEYAGAERATATNADPEQMKLAGAAGEMIERANRDRDADSQHAAGVAMVLVQRPAEGIARLEAAAGQKNDAKSWSDLAAARYAAASQLGRASLYPSALAAADAALRVDPKLPEALFNRALIVERLGLADEARRAWQRYLQVDASSAWAGEARTHLADLPRSTSSSQFGHDRPLLERAAERGDATAVHAYVSTHLGRARAFAESEYLAAWGEGIQRGDEGEAKRWLAITRAIGDALVAINGETEIRDAVHAIDVASDRKPIAAAHILYRSARIAYSRGDGDAAERDFVRAAATFDSAHDPMSLLARYYVASVRLARNDTRAARIDLERVRDAAGAHPSYISLGGRIRWELGRAHMLDDDWAGAVQVFAESAELFHRSGEPASEAFVDAMLADALGSLGREDDAWLARQRGLAALSGDGAVELLAATIAASIDAELRGGNRDNALALSGLEVSIARGASPQVALEALAGLATLEAMNGQSGDALQSARQAKELANATSGAALRERNLAIVAVAEGAALADANPRSAAEPLTRAIDFYAAHDLAAKLPDPLLLRSRCFARMGDAAAAMRDRERGMEIVERHRPEVGGVVVGAGALDAEHALYEDAIRVSLDRGEISGAFSIAERSRGAALTIPKLQERLVGSGTAVLEIVALPDELITFAISANDAIVARRPHASATLEALADESLSESGTSAAATLYDELIRPVEAILGSAREIVIVPDRRLENVPFAALYDSTMQRHLIERFPVSIATSGGSLTRDEKREGAPGLATIALPSGNASTAALPEAVREVREIAAFYTRVESIPATLGALRSAASDAGVVHIAGHTERQTGGGEEALLFAGERVSWKSIVAPPAMRAGVIVLAACETLRPPASAATRALSLGGAFSAAGVRDVVGTLAPIGDRDARLLFGALHRGLASGARSADALRAAQLEAIARDKTNGGRRAWRAVELLTRRIHAPS